ncbi:hypothetical protein [Arenimonas terrae]|uniref:Uncharacterized protein n=1 Tax=Arenimonas terrae TaxID=2546226 RepID=A0A5C4RV88_9GAMM|nr:hypothetical protein [Arenimonas terrae]TNJ34577.1 hypothetical protein E1B00_01970 [Arenimonas terrae]
MTRAHAAPRALAFLLALVVPMLFPASASADSWGSPETKVTFSANRQFRVTVTPRPLGGNLAYFQDKIDGVEPAGQRADEAQRTPIARVEQRAERGAWRLIWQRPLVNDVGPVSALLADDASFLVTFDNWHSAGYGDDTIAIYDREGRLVRKLSLEEILPPAYLHHLPRSVSSRWWGGKHRFVNGGRLLELQVVHPDPNYVRNEVRKHAPVRIRLADGTVLPPGGKAWKRAMAEAIPRENQRLADWQELRRLRAMPLAAPASRNTREWRRYLFELRDRIAGDDEPMGGMVLAAPGEDPGFHESPDISDWILGYSPDKPYLGTRYILASPTSDRLAALLVKALRARSPGSMKNARIVFVGTPAEGKQVAEAAEATGAEIEVIDRTAVHPPGEPLPPSPPSEWMPPPARWR